MHTNTLNTEPNDGMTAEELGSGSGMRLDRQESQSHSTVHSSDFLSRGWLAVHVFIIVVYIDAQLP